MKNVKSMYEHGYAIRRISEYLKIDLDVVNKEIKENNYCLKKEIFNDSKIPFIMELYKDRVSAKALSIKYSIDKRRVQKWATEYGLLRDKFQANRFIFFNQEAFDSINSIETAYWLGFFYADAYNYEKEYRFQLILQRADTNHLYKLADFVNLPRDKISFSFALPKEEKNPNCILLLRSKHLSNKLKYFGCMQAKSLIITYPDWLPNHLHSHFIRGVFDGDGCLTYRKQHREWKFSIAGTSDICDSMCKIIEKYTGKTSNYHNISKTGNNTSELECSGNDKILHILNWLYEDSTPTTRLDRKYDKYLELIELQNEPIKKRSSYKVSSSDKEEIITLLKNKTSVYDLAIKYSVHPRTINKIKAMVRI